MLMLDNFWKNCRRRPFVPVKEQAYHRQQGIRLASHTIFETHLRYVHRVVRIPDLKLETIVYAFYKSLQK